MNTKISWYVHSFKNFVILQIFCGFYNILHQFCGNTIKQFPKKTRMKLNAQSIKLPTKAEPTFPSQTFFVPTTLPNLTRTEAGKSEGINKHNTTGNPGVLLPIWKSLRGRTQTQRNRNQKQLIGCRWQEIL